MTGKEIRDLFPEFLARNQIQGHTPALKTFINLGAKDRNGNAILQPNEFSVMAVEFRDQSIVYEIQHLGEGRILVFTFLFDS